MKNNKFNLVVLHHEEVFATRELALTYLNDFYKPNSLDAEPVMVKYGDTRNPDIILAFGTSDAAPGSFYAIDMTKANEQIEAITNSIDSDEAELSHIASTLEGVIKSTGLKVDENKKEDQVSYDVDTKDNVIGNAITIAEAVDLLSKYVQKEFADTELSVEDTKTVKLIYSVNPDGGKVLKAMVQISTDGDSDDLNFNNNIIGIKSDGLYAASNLSYDDVRHQLIFTTSGYKNGRFQDDAIVQKVDLGEHTKLVADNDGKTVKLTINENTSNYTTTLSADVQISSSEDNILEIKDGKLSVSGRAKNIKYGDTNVAGALNTHGNRLNELDTKVESAAKTAHVEGGQTDTLETEVSLLADGGAKVTGNVRLGSNNSIIVKNGGLEANVTIDVDVATNTLIFTVGNERITKSLPGVNLIERSWYDDNTGNIYIQFKGDTTPLIIPVNEIVHSWDVVNSSNSAIILTKDVITGGTDTLSADVKLRSTDNLIGKENGQLFVSNANIDSKINVETVRATQTETALQSSINTLNDKVAQNLEYVDERITAVKDSITEEKERAIEAENSIRATAEHADETALRAEDIANTASNDVAHLTTDLTETETKLSSLETTVSDNKTEVNDKFEEVKTNISSNTNAIDSLKNDLSNEVTARINSDTELNGRVNLLDNKIDTEIGRAGLAEVELSGKIDTTKSDLIVKIEHDVEDVKHLISDEENRAKAAEEVNADKIKNLEDKIGEGSTEVLAQAKAYTDSEVLAEKNERIVKDTEIENNISTLETKIGNDIAKAVRDASDDASDKANTAKLEANNYTDSKVLEEKERATAAEKTNADTISSLTTEVGKKIEKVEVEKHGDLQYFINVDGVKVGEIIIPEDQFFKGAEYDSTTKILSLTFRVLKDEVMTDEVVNINVSDLVDTYTAGNGLNVENNVFSIRLNTETEKYLTLNADGIGVFGIDAALATKANVTDVENLIEKVNTINGNAALEGSFAKGDADTLKSAKDYTNEKTEEIANSLVAEVERAKSAEKANADAIAILNGNEAEVGSVKNAIKTVETYTDEKVNVEKTAREEAISELTDTVNGKANASEVYTKEEIDSKGYLTEHQDISTLATKNELNTVSDNLSQSFTTLQNEVEKKVEKVEIVKNSQSDLQYTLKVDGIDAGEINIPKDQFLKEVTYDASSKELTFTFETTSGVNVTKIKIDDLVDTYVAGNGLTLTDNKFEVRVNEDSETYLTVSEEGIKLLGIDAALATKANVGDSYTKSESDAKYLTEHQSLADYAKITDVKTVDNKVTALEDRVSTNENKLSVINGNEAEEGSVKNAVKVAKDYTDEKVSEKANVNDVYTKTEIDSKGYLTEHQDISNLATKDSLKETSDKTEQNTIDIAALATSVNDIKFITKESDNIRLTMDKQTGDEYRTLTADVKLKTIEGSENANIIKSDGNGLYATVSFSYDKATNKITFNDGNGDKTFELNNFGILQEAFYESTNKEIVLVVKKDDTTTERITIPVADLVNTWSVENAANSPIVLTKTESNDGDVLSANVSILNHSHNLLTNESGSLFVDSDANKHYALFGGEETNVQAAINILKEKTDEIDSIKQDIEDLEEDNQNIKVVIATYQTDLNNQKDRITRNENDIDALQTGQSQLEVDFERLSLRVDTFDNRITEALTKATEAKNTVEQLKEKLGNIEENENTVAERLNKIEDTIAKLIDFGEYNINF